MDSTTINELTLLEQNRKKIDIGLVYDLMVNSIKGKYKCEKFRKDFVLARSLPLEKVYDPTHVAPLAKNFIDCYANVVSEGKSKCSEKYTKVYECLLKNHGKGNDFPVKCVADMEDYINC
jgi:hypothetical protein